MLLDVFRDDAFQLMPLTQATNLVPFTPTLIGSLGLFNAEPVSTLDVVIERTSEKLSLVPTAPRGAPGVLKTIERRNMRKLSLTHLPQRYAVMADEIQGLRAFGKMTEVETMQAYIAKKRAVPRRDLDLTHEYQRLGALKGQVLDADGTTVLYDYFTEFGVTPTTHTMTFSSSTFPVLQNVLTAKRKSEDALGNVMNSGWLVLCGSGFHDKFTAHAQVKEAFKDYGANRMNRDDLRGGFVFGTDVTWREYRGKIGTTPMIAVDEAIMIPMGVPDLCTSYFGPAPYMETVNTMGQVFYEKMKVEDWDTGVEFQLQSNPLHMVNRPDAIVRLTAN
jgi:hypothetical protein